MPIRGVVVDVSDTLLRTNNELVDGVALFWRYCNERDIKIIVASNQQSSIDRLRQLGYTGAFSSTRKIIGKSKGSPEWVTTPASRFELDLNSMVYIGDHDFNDAVTAAHAKIPYIRAAWANPTGKYGIGLDSLERVTRYLDIFMSKEHYWFWRVDGTDTLGQAFKYRAMVDCRTNDPAQSSIKQAATDVLKGRSLRRRAFFLHHLLTSLFMSGIATSVDYWTTYPGHEQGSQGHDILGTFLQDASKLFADKYLPLLHRHTEALSSNQLRRAQKHPELTEQIRTLSLDPAHRRFIADHHILVVDDFTTSSNSLAWSRALLLQAGAREVTSVAVGKYSTACKTLVPRSTVRGFDPFRPVNLAETDFFVQENYSSLRVEEINQELQQSMELYDKNSPWPI